jgi:signal transduction histidine kinase
MRVENWLRENEGLILPAWIRRVRSKGLIGFGGMSTQELRHHVFLIYYDRLCKALAEGSQGELDQVLDKLISEHIHQDYEISQILQFPLQFKSTIWQFLLQDFAPSEAMAMMEQVEPLLDHSVDALVEGYARMTQTMLDDFDFLTRRLSMANEETERTFKQLHSLYGVSRTLNSTLDIQHTLEAIADNLVALPPIEYCVIWQVTPQNMLQVGVMKGQVGAGLAHVTLPLVPPTSFISHALSTRHRTQFEAQGDLAREPALGTPGPGLAQADAPGATHSKQPKVAVHRTTRGEGVRECGSVGEDPLASLLDGADAIAFPMFNEKEPIGVIMTNSRHEGRPLDSSIVSLVQSVSEQAAMALKNAQLYDQVMRFNQELEEKVRQRTQELEEINIELERVNRDLERLDRTKSDFISIAAHELKTPLTLIQGYTNILRDNNTIKSSPILTRLMQGILQGGQRLKDIIDSMIDVSVIDTHVLQLCPSQISIRNILQTLVRPYASALQERRLVLTLDDLGNLPYIEADAKRLYQVFENLLLNAIKYTPDGGKIAISGRVLDMPSEEQWVEVVVCDSGIGIDPQDQERIFDKFYQTGELSLHSSGKTKFKGGGPGLGLAIAKGIVQAHGGKIWVESPGHDEETCPGSQFHVVLPVKSQSKRDIVPPFAYECEPAG